MKSGHGTPDIPDLTESLILSENGASGHSLPEPATGVLVLCTANVCRSVMAAAFLRRSVRERGVSARVQSAGFRGPGHPPPSEVVLVMARHRLDVSFHRSRAVSKADLTVAHLVIGMTRGHVRLAVAAVPAAWSRCYTLRELVRRGETGQPRKAGEPFEDWLTRIHQGRSRSEMLGDDPADDVADPVGGPPHTYAETAAAINELITRLAGLCWGSTGDLGTKSW